MKMDDLTSWEGQPPPDFVLMQVVYLTASGASFFKTCRLVMGLFLDCLSLFLVLVKICVHRGLFMSLFCVMAFLVLVLEVQQDFGFLLKELWHLYVLLFTEVLQILVCTRLLVNEDFCFKILTWTDIPQGGGDDTQWWWCKELYFAIYLLFVDS